MPGGKKGRSQWMPYSSLGLEFAAAVAGFTLVGWWVDTRWQTAPTGLLTGAVLGLVGGGYNFLKSSMRALQEAEEERRQLRAGRSHDADSNADHSDSDQGDGNQGDGDGGERSDD